MKHSTESLADAKSIAPDINSLLNWYQGVFRPVDFGAVGDGINDDRTAIEACFDAAVAAGAGAVIDLRGDWYVGSMLTITTPDFAEIRAGGIHALSGTTADHLTYWNLGRATHIRGVMRINGVVSTHLVNRTIGTLVQIYRAVDCSFDGFILRYANRNGIELAPQGSLIGCNLGRIFATAIGSPGNKGANYASESTTATDIQRTGTSAGTNQRAQLTVSADLAYLQIGDVVFVNTTDAHEPANGGDVCVVTDIGQGEIEVYPWPPSLDGVTGPIPNGAEVVSCGGAVVYLSGGNTSAVRIEGLSAQYAGVVLRASSIAGPMVDNLLGEVVGVVLQIQDINVVNHGTFIRGFHGEVRGLDILQAGITDARAVIAGLITDTRRYWYSLSPTVTGGFVHTKFSQLTGITILDGRPPQQDGTSQTRNEPTILTVGNRTDEQFGVRVSATSVRLRLDPDELRLFGSRSCEVEVRGALTVTVDIHPDRSGLDTINGLATDAIVMSGPGLIRFWYNSGTSDWEYVVT